MSEKNYKHLYEDCIVKISVILEEQNPTRERICAIVANGIPTPIDKPIYSQVLSLYRSDVKQLESKLKKLQEDNKKLVEGLKIYADSNNWEYDDSGALECWWIGKDKSKPFENGYNIARQIMKEIGQ